MTQIPEAKALARAVRRHSQGAVRAHGQRIVKGLVAQLDPMVVSLVDHEVEIESDHLLLGVNARFFDAQYGIEEDDTLLLSRLDDGDWFVLDVISEAEADEGGGGDGDLAVSGKIVWAPGDTNLYRSAANTLRTDDSFEAALDITARPGTAMQTRIGNVAGNAGVYFGSALDTNLYRTTAHPWRALKTDGVFEADEVGIAVGQPHESWIGGEGPAGQAGLVLGSAYDTNLYRSAAGTLKTDGWLLVGGGVNLDTGNSGVGLYFGSAADTKLYRASVNTLKTDGSLQVVGSTWLGWSGSGWQLSIPPSGSMAANGPMQFYSWAQFINYTYWPGGTNIDASGNLTAGKTFAVMGDPSVGASRFSVSNNIYINSTLIFWDGVSSYDTNLYRASANVLKTDGNFVAGATLRADWNSALALQLTGAGGGITFGGDTNLYRASPGWLKTDNSMTVAGTFYLGAGSDAYIYREAGNIIATSGSYVQRGARGGWGFLGYVYSDAQPTTYLRNDGYLLFGPGGSAALDMSLYREAGVGLRTDNLLHLGPNSLLALNAGNTTLPQIEFAWQGSNRQYRHWISTVHNGGSAPGNYMDFNIWTTGQSVDALGSMRALRLDGDGKLWIGPAADVSLYRAGAYQLQTNSYLVAGKGIQAGVESDGTTPALGIRFGASADTNLYRSAPDTLKTDDSFVVGGSLTVSGTFSAGTFSPANISTPGNLAVGGAIYFGVGDVNLYRLTADNLKTDDTLHAAGSLVASSGGAGHVYVRNDSGRVYFGVNDDVSLYRSGGGALSTGGTFAAGGRFFSGGPATGGIWVDGGSNQFVGSQDGSHLGLYNGGWHLLVGNDGKTVFNGSPNLYRWASNGGTPTGELLATDAGLYVRGTYSQFDNNIYAQAAIILGGDAILRRNSPGAVQCDGGLVAVGALVAQQYEGPSGYIGLYVSPYNVGQRQVLCGNPDSGGTGYRTLLILN